MPKKCFRNITKQKSEETAFSALINKKENGSNGRSLKNGDKLQMSNYFCPYLVLSVEEHREIQYKMRFKGG